MNIFELLVIALVALIVLGPKRLPEVASALGKFVKMCRNLNSTIKSEFEKNINQQQLEHNQKRAEEVDKLYQKSEEK